MLYSKYHLGKVSFTHILKGSEVQVKRINVNIDDELHKAVRMKCVETGVTVQSLIEKSLRAWTGVSAEPVSSPAPAKSKVKKSAHSWLDDMPDNV
jgi:hypothetical protein